MKRTSATRKDKDSVRALTRGLTILRYINTQGQAKASQISAALDIPRPTVYRLLQTLEEQGYIVHSPTDNRVRITRQAAALGDSYQSLSQICMAAGPVFSHYASQLIWPLDLTTYDNGAMVVQETTHPRSPLSIDRGMTGSRIPIARTSAGWAYLAFCPPAQRKLILNHIHRLRSKEDAYWLEPGRLDALITAAAACGYSIRSEGPFKPKTSSIAVPVLLDGSVVACVSMIWIRSAMSTEEAISNYEGPLHQIAEAIAETAKSDQELSRSGPHPSP